jgi:hypothetical protein
MNINSDMVAVARTARIAVARSGLKTAKADKFATAYVAGARGYAVAMYGADSDAANVMGGLLLRVTEGGAAALAVASGQSASALSLQNLASAGDNAAMESFFSLLQKNVLDRQRWATRDELRIEIIIWIERTYNRRRRQRRLGRLTPVEFELALENTDELAA